MKLPTYTLIQMLGLLANFIGLFINVPSLVVSQLAPDWTQNSVVIEARWNNNKQSRIDCKDKTSLQLVRPILLVTARLFIFEWQHRRVYKQKNTLPATVFIDNNAWATLRVVLRAMLGVGTYFSRHRYPSRGLGTVFSLCAFNFECAN